MTTTVVKLQDPNAEYTYFNDWNFFYNIDSTDGYPLSSEVLLKNLKAIEQQILYLISTNKGSREFEPTFGSKLPSLLFEPCDDQTGTFMQMAVIEAIGFWIPRVQILPGSTYFIPVEDDATFYGQISYKVLDLDVKAILTLKLPSLAASQ